MELNITDVMHLARKIEVLSTKELFCRLKKSAFMGKFKEVINNGKKIYSIK